MSRRYIGRSVPRQDGLRLVTGAGHYLDDLGRSALAAAFVRSTHAHARITHVDTSRAATAPGVVGVYTFAELPAALAEPLPLLIPHPALTHPRTGRLLADRTVHHTGEPIAMIIAGDRYLAEDACALVQVDYDPLPAVIGLDSALAAQSLAHSDVPDNLAALMVQQFNNVDDAIPSAPHRLHLTLDIERSAAAPLEGRGVYAEWDTDAGVLRVYSSTQSTAGVRAAIAARLSLPPSCVECIAPDTGGGFGVKIMHPWPEEILIPWAAQLLEHRVKWVEDRFEHFTAASHERAQRHSIEVGFDDTGRILGLDVDFVHDNGAYTPYGIIVPIVTATQLLGPYKPAAYRVRFRSLYTNTAIVTPYRGAGRPQGVFAMERTLDAIARKLHVDRLHVRQANLIHPHEMPYNQHLTFQDGQPLVYDSGDYPATLDTAARLIGWHDFPAQQAQARAEGRLIGIGIGCYVEGSGIGPYEGAHIEVDTSGNVTVSTGVTTQGQGHDTVLAQIAADRLSVPIDTITVVTGDTRRFDKSAGTFASRSTVTAGNAVALAADKIRTKAIQIAAHLLDTTPDQIAVVDGLFHKVTSPQTNIPLAAIAALANPLRYAFDANTQAATQFTRGRTLPALEPNDEPGLQAHAYHAPTQAAFANGAHAAIVETDPETAEIRIVRYCAVHDCGVSVNPALSAEQVRGGAAQGIAGALLEQLHYAPDGQLLNASYRDFLMPYATDLPPFEVHHLQTPSPLNPLGVKGIGESGVIPVSGVLAAAIEDAEGIPVTRMPLHPADLFHLRGGRLTDSDANPATQVSKPCVSIPGSEAD
ncbi:aerobic carbon-monoxide dehydrogenase large subunit [Streptomyces sp. NPDC127051]|uniref:aerobic carbon-monoxide dehydrogenase large subunit n=1 Tax=Streptomyces sp. NPDC127051 TaxID=3347119 RepID=UPI0036557258